MTTCVNCTQEAQFRYNVTPKTPIFYCATHLPKFLRGRGMASLLLTNLATERKEPETPAPTPKKKTSKKKVEEPVAEEEPILEEPVEESTEEPVEDDDGAN